MRFDTLDAWLAWLERLHPHSIELGLERVRRVAEALGLGAALPCPVVTVAGTNGKGSSVALLESILSAAGYRVAAYTSPHLLRYNERVRIGAREASDAELCQAFDRVDRARGAVSLTYFEFGTLAAFDHFARARPDVAVLEVGMGGRLDAVNLLDCDVALVTSIGIDHVDWLGHDREAIGAEKAGIFRRGRPAVCSDPAPPRSLTAAAADRGALLHLPGRDFGWSAADSAAGAWTWWGGGVRCDGLPPPALAGRFQYHNAAGVLMALRLLDGRLEVPRAAVEEGLRRVSLPGRFQRLLVDGVPCILDVAHNPDGTEALARTLADEPVPGRTRAVAAILGDKDIDGMISSLADVVDDWYVADLPVERAAPVERLRDSIAVRAQAEARIGADAQAAFRAAVSAALPGDRVVVFGSFHTVGAVLRALRGGVAGASS
ncbi:MAG: bifunctional tetrahydrofolate synthase/dihydrofolate synthase [Gammaproteobacteria bacterium]